MIQLLFTHVFCADKINYLDAFIEMQGSGEIEKAFLAQCAYDYFVNDTVTDDYVFERIEKLLSDKEKINRVSKLSLLKYYSNSEKEVWNVNLIEDLVNEELEKKVCFPFFLLFEPVVKNLQSYSDYSFVEYRGNPRGHVVIHYCVEHDDGVATEYRKEEMNHLFSGIFVKSFILF